MQDLLLPEQLQLKERLLHAIRYSLQTVVIEGAQGSGKTSLAKQALESLDEYNQAWLQCPKHMTDKELRQKVLFQWYSNALYDDQLTLEQNLLAHPPSRLQRHVIFLDDADNLTHSQLLELLRLAQTDIAIAVVLLWSKRPSFFNVSSELIFKLEPLALAQRKLLFEQTLKNANAEIDYTEDLLEFRLKNTSGFPADIIFLAKEAIANPEGFKQRKGRLIASMLISVTLIIVIMVSAWLILPRLSQQPIAEQQFAKPIVAAEFKPEVISTSVNSKAIDTAINSTEPKLSIAAESGSVKADVEPMLTETVAQVTDKGLAAERPIPEPAKGAVKLMVEPQSKISLPRNGYTLQLAAVKELKSLQPLMSSMQYQQHWVIKTNQIYILLVGHVADSATANKLKQSDPNMKSAWIRPWSKVVELQPEIISETAPRAKL
ncbi:AAA family ATPase [Paraferrimonas sp. SM1919]|uniref:AAA family ATPase n=1 Tax=Paraferrimonas sp. SM1919 TaxID=2662263 RepID=UPI0013D77B1C|nr:AAA family ATPase [Paraferrimonas sp. SM1919]